MKRMIILVCTFPMLSQAMAREETTFTNPMDFPQRIFSDESMKKRQFTRYSKQLEERTIDAINEMDTDDLRTTYCLASILAAHTPRQAYTESDARAKKQATYHRLLGLHNNDRTTVKELLYGLAAYQTDEEEWDEDTEWPAFYEQSKGLHKVRAAHATAAQAIEAEYEQLSACSRQLNSQIETTRAQLENLLQRHRTAERQRKQAETDLINYQNADHLLAKYHQRNKDALQAKIANIKEQITDLEQQRETEKAQLQQTSIKAQLDELYAQQAYLEQRYASIDAPRSALRFWAGETVKSKKD